MVAGFESVSTWRQPLPEPGSPARSMLIETVAGQIAELSPGRLRVAVDGLTGAGKTSFAHELAAALRVLGRPTMRASMDDFKHPWRHAREHGYERVSGEGYYRNAYDFTSARDLLLHPAGPGGMPLLLHLGSTDTTSIPHTRQLPWQYARWAAEEMHKETDMQLQSLTPRRLRRTPTRGLQAIADALLNQGRHRERHARPQREQAIAGNCSEGMPGTTTVAPTGRRVVFRETAGPRQPTGIRSRGKVTAMKPHKYQALVTLHPPGDGGLDAEPPRHILRLAVRPDHRSELFSALVSAADGSLLRPGTADITAIIVVLGDDVGDDLAPGEQFALLSGGEVGHGVVSRRLFT